MPLCGEATLVNTNGHIGEISALRCKRWSCETCQPFNRQKVMQAAKEGNPNIFLTLTCDSKRYDTPEEAARDMKRGLVLLRRQIARRFNVKNVPFIVVFERTKKGWPHMHLLMRGSYMHWKKLRGMWQSIVGAAQIDIRFIKRKEHVLHYVTKYIGKDLAAFKGCKRWWRSHNYSEADADDEPLHLFGDQVFRVNVPYHVVRDYVERTGGLTEKLHRLKCSFKYADSGGGFSPRPLLYEQRASSEPPAYSGRGR